MAEPVPLSTRGGRGEPGGGLAADTHLRQQAGLTQELSHLVQAEVRTEMAHTEKLRGVLQGLLEVTAEVILDGHSLTIPQVVAASEKSSVVFKTREGVTRVMEANAGYLAAKIQEGTTIYGVNTGYGGSADVRSDDLLAIQRALVHHLNAGFGRTLEASLVRAVMAVRANSLSHGYSGVRPAVVECLLQMLNADIVPVVPLRGSISASGDLMPTSYIAACMMGRPDARLLYAGSPMTVAQALEQGKFRPVEFQAKEALAVVNAASFASSLGCCVLYDACYCVLLTQAATALSVESLRGRVESFHPTLHACMPHAGQEEVAANITRLLAGSQLAVQQLDMDLEDRGGLLKQDRYALRSAAQWLAPALATLTRALDTVTTDINSANDNPIIDHRRGEILHGANFQGTSGAVAMDQARQALQLCGKLLFAQMSEMLNVKMSNNLPPNLCGSDPNIDFGLKGTDTAMASYMSELDYLTGPLTNHVLSAEMHNQSVNSLGLISARMTQQALEILQMMLANISLSHVQAIDLRWLQAAVEARLTPLIQRFDIKPHIVTPELFPWYKFAFQPADTATALMEFAEKNGPHRETFVEEMKATMAPLVAGVTQGERVQEIADTLGKGTKEMYLFLRRDLQVPFCDGQRPLDTMLETIHSAIQRRANLPQVLAMFQ